MGERQRYEPGTFCWADLGTHDVEAAAAFYVGLFGWEVDAGDTGLTFRLDGHAVCGVRHPDAGQGLPGWLQYVSVTDAGAVAEAARAAGALEVRDAVVQDPTGAHVALRQPENGIGATLVNVPGAMCLNQLNTPDPERAAAFYTEVFGWRIEQVGAEPVPYWGIWNGDGLNGGMMNLPPGSPAPPHWLPYFATDDVEPPAARVAELGGTVVVPPMAVPGGRIVVALDAQGATFGLLDGRLDP